MRWLRIWSRSRIIFGKVTWPCDHHDLFGGQVIRLDILICERPVFPDPIFGFQFEVVRRESRRLRPPAIRPSAITYREVPRLFIGPPLVQLLAIKIAITLI